MCFVNVAVVLDITTIVVTGTIQAPKSKKKTTHFTLFTVQFVL